MRVQTYVRLLNAIAALALIVFIATVVMWVRSYYVTDIRVISKDPNGIEWVWISKNGRFGKAVSKIDPVMGGRVVFATTAHYYLEIAGPAFAAQIFWLSWWVMLRRMRRYHPGACHVCGYDLRGSSERCLECGTTVTMSFRD